MQKISITLLAAVLCLTCAVSMSAQSDNVLRNPQVSYATGFAITPPLRDLVKNRPTELQFGYHVARPVLHPKQNLALKSDNSDPNFADQAVQTENVAASIPNQQLY